MPGGRREVRQKWHAIDSCTRHLPGSFKFITHGLSSVARTAPKIPIDVQSERHITMTFFKSLPAHAGPPVVYQKYPEVFGPWSEMSQAVMNGPSPLTQGEREMIFAYAAGVAGCKFVHVAHSAVAYAWGIEKGLVERLIENPDTTPVEARLKPLLAF